MEDILREHLEESSGNGPAFLEIRNGPEDGRVFAIGMETVRIGRQPPELERAQGKGSVGNFVIRSDKAVSREHCEITALSSAAFLLTDLGSRFGTELNGVRITAPTPCRSGDTITVGDTALMLRI